MFVILCDLWKWLFTMLFFSERLALIIPIKKLTLSLVVLESDLEIKKEVKRERLKGTECLQGDGELGMPRGWRMDSFPLMWQATVAKA